MGETLEKAIAACLTGPVRKLVLSDPRRGAKYVRIAVRPLKGGYQAEQSTGKQVFHHNLTAEALPAYLAEQMLAFRQLNAWDASHEHIVLVSDAQRVTYRTRACAKPTPPAADVHDRAKNYILREGEIVPPLVDMGVLTGDGRVVRAMYDKFKQINRFLEMIDDVIGEAYDGKPLSVVDFGCGKSYLTYVLYHYFTAVKRIDARITGVDRKADVIEACRRVAQKYGYDGLTFAAGDIADFARPGGVDMVVSLHACDTATDQALFQAVAWNAKYIFSVPCCQHELNGQMQGGALPLLTRYGIVQERAAALLTDAIRANLLCYAGYKTQVMEFVDLSHTPKNLLIRAVRARIPEAKRLEALAEVRAAVAAFSLDPALLRLMGLQ